MIYAINRIYTLHLVIFYYSLKVNTKISTTSDASDIHLYGYDCEDPHAKFTSIDLTKVDVCKPADISELRHKDEQIQIVQHRAQIDVELFSCGIEKYILISWCGHYSHLSPVPQGKRTILKDVDRDECERMIKNKSHYEGRIYIDGLQINSTTYLSYMEVGEVDMDADCETGTYIMDGIEYTNVVVQVSIRISLYQMKGIYRVAQGDILMVGGYICSYTEGDCNHPVYGKVFWKEFNTDYCHPTGVEVLYQGPANVTQSKIEGEDFSIVSVMSSGTTFALRLGKPSRICYHQVISTDFPRIFVIWKSNYGFYFQPTMPTALNADMAAYWSTRLTTLEFHTSRQLTGLYRNLWMNTCENRRQILQNKLMAGIHNPELFGYIYTGERGIGSVITGEVAHVMKCPRIKVVLRETSSCFNSLPVYKQGKPGFLRPFTHIFVNQSEEVECNPMMPPTYRLTSEWISLIPHVTLARNPLMLMPHLNTSYWKYTPLSRFSSSGLYSLSTIQQVQEILLSPISQKIADNYLKRGISGKVIASKDYNIYPLFSQQDLNDIQQSFFEKTWGVFASFGQSISGFIGIYFLVRLIKGTVSTLINGYELKQTVGGWWAVLAACSGALTQMIIRRVDQIVQVVEDNERVDQVPQNPTDIIIPIRGEPQREYDQRIYPVLSSGDRV